MHAVCVPPQMLDDVWPHVSGLISKAVRPFVEGKREELAAIVHGAIMFKSRQAQLWIVTDDAEKRIVAAAATEVQTETETGRRIVWAHAMAGEKPLRVGKLLMEAVSNFARAEGCAAVCFAGRPALERVYPGAKPVTRYLDGEVVFERSVLQ